MLPRFIASALAIALLLLSGAIASPHHTPHDLCRVAAVTAARTHHVPEEVLLAITTVETRTNRGGESGPWPWTVNVAGQGTWFDSFAEARSHAAAALASGQTSFDVGCFQLNYRWHGQEFSGLDEMFDPATSADYAARFLKSLHAESGDWLIAAGHYHSRTPRHSQRYRRAISAVMSSSEIAGTLAEISADEKTTPIVLGSMEQSDMAIAEIQSGGGGSILLGARAPIISLARGGSSSSTSVLADSNAIASPGAIGLVRDSVIPLIVVRN